jgi:nitric oxide reductase NorQ protein
LYKVEIAFFIIKSDNMENNAVYYKATGKEIEVFEHCFRNQLPILLKGPTGTGKSRFVEYMAAHLGQKMVSIVCHEETSTVDLLGRYIVKGANTEWIDGPLTQAVREGSIIYLDEIAEARPDVLVAIHSLTDHRRTLYLDRHHEVMVAPESFMLVASFNPGYQKGYKELKPSTRQRFVGLSFQYPTKEVETEIVIQETGVEKAVASKLVVIAAKIRGLVELGMTETASTRLLVDAAKLIHSGLPPRLSCNVAIAEPLSDDEDTLKALRDLISFVF